VSLREDEIRNITIVTVGFIIAQRHVFHVAEIRPSFIHEIGLLVRTRSLLIGLSHTPIIGVTQTDDRGVTQTDFPLVRLSHSFVFHIHSPMIAVWVQPSYASWQIRKHPPNSIVDFGGCFISAEGDYLLGL